MPYGLFHALHTRDPGVMYGGDMKDGINSRVMKVNNALLVLETIMRRAPIARSELTGLMRLTQVSVINVTNALLDAGIIVEAGRANSGNQGRRSMVLDINEHAFYCLGLELSVGKLVCGLGDARGRLLQFEELQFSPRSSAEVLVDKVEELTGKFLRENRIDRSRILGMGIAVPGPLDVQEGVMINPPNFPGWKNVPIRRMLEERLGFRVCLDKETNLAALAESFYGVSAGYKTSFFLSLFRLGIGGGLISESNIFHGFCDGAGEVGHMTVEPSGRKCGCGNYGCLETMIAEDYIIEQVCHLYKLGVEIERPEDIDSITLEEIFERSSKGDSVCQDVIKQMAAYISIAVGNIVNMFSPELIVLGGPLPDLSTQLVELVAERVHSKKYPLHCRKIKIEKSALGSQVYVKGAIALAEKTFLHHVLPENF